MPQLLIRAASCWLAALVLLTLGCQPNRPPPQAQFVRQIGWAESGVWLKADTHVHTRFSDGGVDLREVVRQSAAFGCDVLAITDHGDSELAATSDEYFDALQEARVDFPELILLAGLEWNVPPWQGREHACLLVPPGPLERRTLRDFQTLFDDWRRPGRDPELALHALDWLETRANASGTLPLVIYNHPSRKRDGTQEFVDEIHRWLDRSDAIVGFEGAPGHQDSQPLGSYRHTLQTIDRWDPVAAEIGGAWDQLLQQGRAVWGAVATSDFHSADPDQPDDYWPGEFSETWLYAPSRSADGAFAALQAGSFFGVHGHIAREVQLAAYSVGLPRPAMAGEAVRVPQDAIVEISLTLDQPLLDWQGNANQLDEIELIAILPEEVKSVAQERPMLLGKALSVTLVMPPTDVTIRARGRRVVPDGPDLMFYTNPIQLFASGNRRAAPAATPATAVSLPAASLPAPESARSGSLREDIRQVPAWLVLAFVAGGGACLTLAVQWQVEIRRRFARDGQASAAATHTTPLPLRRHLLAALAGFVFLAVYGSWVPLVPAEMDWSTATQRFQQVLVQPLSFESRMDWTTNVVLFVPIGLFATGLLLGRAPSDRRRVLALPVVVFSCALLSVGIEFGQLWIHDRTCSQNDIVAETLGALIGGIGWLVGGPVVVRWLDRLRDADRPREQVERALELYLLVAAAYLLLPMDLTLRPAELWHKFQAGRIQFVPLVDVLGDMQAAMSVLSSALILLPVGGLVALWRWPEARTTRPLAPALAMGLVIVVALEAGQALVYSRHSSTTDLLAGLAAVAAGWGMARLAVSRGASQGAAADAALRGLLLALAPLLAAAALVAIFCLPFDRVLDTKEAWPRLAAMLSRSPLEALYWGTPLNAVFDVLRKLLLFGVLGGLLALAMAHGRVAGSHRLSTLLLGWIAAVALAAGVEILQAWLPPHVPDLTDVLLAAIGAAIGLATCLRLSRRP